MNDKLNKTKIKLNTTAVDDNNRHYKFNIEYYVFVENGSYIAYCPALDLSSSGKTFNDAVSAFYECFQLYIESCIDSDTLFADLQAHGWKVSRKSIKAPAFTSLLKKPEMKRLVNSGIGFEKIVSPAQIAMS